MAKRSKSKRSLAVKKGWATQRRRAAAEFRRRSKASKKGWRGRKAKEIVKEKAKQKPKGKGKLQAWIVTRTYQPREGSLRQIDLVVIARSREDAQLMVYKAEAKGHDSKGGKISWMTKIPWDEEFVMSLKEAEEDDEEWDKKAIRAAGEGWTEVR